MINLRTRLFINQHLILQNQELEKDKGTYHTLSCKSKGQYNSKLNPLYFAFFHGIKLSRHKTGTKFNAYLLAVKLNNYLIKIGNVYIVYDLDAWPRNPTNNFEFKNYLFGATSIVNIVWAFCVLIMTTLEML